MNEQRTSLEIIAPSVDDAVAKGLEELGLPEDAVEVEVLDAGSRGLFGLGYRQARVRLTIKGAQKQTPGGVEAVEEPGVEAAVDIFPAAQTPAVSVPPAKPRTRPTRSDAGQIDAAASDANVTAAGELDPDRAHTLQVARDTVKELLEKMKVPATVTAHYATPDDQQDRPPLMVDVNGKDLSVLIGPKAETLNALQYIAGLIVSKEIGHSIPLVIDVEGYRARRSQQIRQIARRMAEQAVRTGRRQVLEPMPANERRLIHIELRNNPDVTTESQGEEPRRKVTIIPK